VIGAKLTAAVSQLHDAPLSVDGSPELSIADIRERLRESKEGIRGVGASRCGRDRANRNWMYQIRVEIGQQFLERSRDSLKTYTFL